MGFRFRTSVKLFPGVRLNVGRKSASLSLGPRGIKRTYSTTGRRTTSIDLPGPFSWTTSARKKTR
ncbi:DUF4236 domain-containing protein [Streptacidiphilus cavernicola]|uniref:DUF4236 domain-containing protein n=1 Tax=Streptacidiphilus cavernicola TaxID=3342716 RepID=A0ABV6VY49_9ACTN